MASEAYDPNSTEPEILLGFCEKVDNWELHRAYFRPKAGGFPAWLNPDQTPKVLCPFCQQSMMLLLQAYAEKQPEHAYHRVIYVFTCRNGECHKTSIESTDAVLPYKVLRCQLSQNNQYYELEPCENYENDKKAMINADKKIAKDFCFNCGQLANGRCTGCKSVAYCGKTCQTHHWKTGHKKVCKTKKKPTSNFIYPTKKSSWSFDEYEIVIEPEPSTDKKSKKSEIEAENAKLMKEIAEKGEDYDDDDLQAMAGDGKNVKVDKVFEKFQKRIKRDPEQVLRYIQDDVRKRSAGILHISEEGKQQSDNFYNEDMPSLPACPLCKSERVLEFQVMPQILNQINADKSPFKPKDVSLHEKLQENEKLATSNFGVDFGVLNVYTCKMSCKIDKNGYAEEFLTREMVAPDSIGAMGENEDDDESESDYSDDE